MDLVWGISCGGRPSSPIDSMMVRVVSSGMWVFMRSGSSSERFFEDARWSAAREVRSLVQDAGLCELSVIQSFEA